MDESKKIRHRMIFAGDIGGTKTRLGLFQVEKNGFHLLSEKTFPSKKYTNLSDILRDFLAGQKNIVSACFGVAGPVTGEIVKTTNLPWVINAKSLKKEISLNNLKIIGKLKEGTFMDAFTKKGRLSDIVSRIPVKVIINDRAALLGAAYSASSSLKRE